VRLCPWQDQPSLESPVTSSAEGFPPQDLPQFLALCVGEWLALRSHFDLALAEREALAQAGAGESASGDGSPPPTEDEGMVDLAALLASTNPPEAALDEAWHSSERTQLQVSLLEPAGAAAAAGLQVCAAGGASQQVRFQADGSFHSTDGADQEASGQWVLTTDGILELTLERPGGLLVERIWFTKPNLRLRSSIERSGDGVPGRARFSSEIRRVSRPAADSAAAG